MNLTIKILGAFLVVASTTSMGIKKSKSFSDRLEYLENMQLCINQLKNEINYTQTPLINAIEKIISSSFGITRSIFVFFLEELSFAGDESIKKLWDNAIGKYHDKISESDYILLTSLGNNLGNCDLEGQLKNFALFESRISQAIKTAHSEKEKFSKLYRNLGIYSGLLIATLFL